MHRLGFLRSALPALAIVAACSDAGPALADESRSHSIRAGAGFTDVSPHQLVRTRDGRLWVIVPTCDSFPKCPGARIKAWRSSAAGLAATFVEADAAGAPGVDVGTTALAVDDTDRIHVLWNERSGKVRHAVVDGRAGTWGPAEDADPAAGWTDFGQGDEGTALAFDAGGTLHAAWTARVDGALRIRYARRTAGGWEAATLVDDAPLAPGRHAWHPTLAFGPGGELWLAWLEGSTNYTPDGVVRVRGRTAAGAWAPSEAIPDSAMTSIDNGPSLIATADGVAHLAFCDAGNAIRYWYRDGSGWKGDLQPERQVTHNPSLGPDGAGGVYLYGHGTPGPGIDGHGDDLFRFRKTAGGRWGAWTRYATGSFDSSVTTRWSQFFHAFPEIVDVAFWSDRYPNDLYIGTEVGPADRSRELLGAGRPPENAPDPAPGR